MASGLSIDAYFRFVSDFRCSTLTDCMRQEGTLCCGTSYVRSGPVALVLSKGLWRSLRTAVVIRWRHFADNQRQMLDNLRQHPTLAFLLERSVLLDVGSVVDEYIAGHTCKRVSAASPIITIVRPIAVGRATASVYGPHNVQLIVLAGISFN